LDQLSKRNGRIISVELLTTHLSRKVGNVGDVEPRVNGSPTGDSNVLLEALRTLNASNATSPKPGRTSPISE
jgi:hypothetical protein